MQLEQVLVNLAINARDAMPKGGKLIIETTNVELDAHYAQSHPGVLPGSYVMLAVSDTGHGMDKETLSHIFEPFFTTKEFGTGLGLATVYGIIQQSGGNIWVYSELGKGTTFKMYLPCVEEASEPLASRTKVIESFRGTETVLVVEDDSSVRSLVSAILEMNGYRVLTAADPAEAVNICKHNQEKIDLMITDVVMPDMSGRDLAQLLATEGYEIKVIYMSGYTDDAILHYGVSEESIPFLQKPFTAEALTRKIREVLNPSLTRAVQ